jgi:membrane-associated HD superfamily phosphohydrolase
MFLFQAVSITVDQTLLGTEKVDVGSEVRFKKLVRSNLLYVSLINICAALTYLAGMFAVLSFAFSEELGLSVAVALWALVQLCVTILFLIIKGRRASRSATLFRGWKVAYNLVSAMVMVFAVDLLSRVVLNSSAGGFVYGLELCVVLVLGAAVYFGLLYAVDPRFRAMLYRLLKREAQSSQTL